MTLDKAQGSGFSLKPIDVAPLVIKGMTGQRTRGVIVYSNWVIVAQCPTDGNMLVGQTLSLGVVKVAEMPADLGVPGNGR